MPTLREAHLLHARHFLAVLWEANRLYRNGGSQLRQGLALIDQEWGNILAAQSRMRLQSGEDADAAKLCSEYPNAAAHFLPLRLRPSERVNWLEVAAAAAQRIADREAESWHLGNLGKLYRTIGEPRLAIEHTERAMLISRQFGDRLNEVRGLMNLALAYCEMNDIRRALQINEEALLLARELQDRREEGAVLGNIGIVHAVAGDQLKAIEFYKQQLLIAQEIGDIAGEAEVSNNIGLAYLKLIQPHMALDFLSHAWDLYQDMNDRQALVPLLNNIGLVYLNTGRPEHALNIFIQQEAISRLEESPLGEGRALFNQAEAYAMIGSINEAIFRAEAALRVFERIECVETNIVQSTLAEWRERLVQH